MTTQHLDVDVEESMMPQPMDPESLRDLLEAFEAAMDAVQATGASPDVLVDITRMFLLASAGWHESNGQTMPPSKFAVRKVLGMLTGLLRANGDL